jgi:hypothetical protein
MLTCPMCKKPLRGMTRECPGCRTDLSLLVDYAGALHEGLARAEMLTRSGELGEAVWSYLEVLEIDPDSPIARRQVGQVVAAVRQFDEHAPGRRWGRHVRGRALGWGEFGWFGVAVCLILVLAALVIGFILGHRSVVAEPSDPMSYITDSPRHCAFSELTVCRRTL